MPRGDGTGPRGMGPMTGRGAGFCAGFVAPGYINPGMNYGMGYGMGYGRGRGFRRQLYYTGVPAWDPTGYSAYSGAFKPSEDEKEYLSSQVEVLENQLQQVKKRLKDINGEDE